MTTENSCADALRTIACTPAPSPACKRCGATTAQACNDKGCFYLESGDGEPAAAPIEAISKLLDEAMDRAAANGADSRSMPDEYVAIAHFTCYPEQYGYVPAPSPANERAAFDMSDAEWCDVFERIQKTVPNVFGSYAKVRAEFAREAIRIVDAARAASANETGAESLPYGHEFADMDGERHFKRGALPSYAQSNIVPLYAAPQPAQADARVGLTDARIARLRAAIEGECDGLHVDYHHAKAILAYLDDDRA